MAMSTIDRVKAAEIAANEARDKAELEAKAIIDDAQTLANGVIEEAKVTAQEDEKAQTARAKADADELIRIRRQKAQENADALRDKTMKLRQNVINKLILETLES